MVSLLQLFSINYVVNAGESVKGVAHIMINFVMLLPSCTSHTCRLAPATLCNNV